MSINHSLNVLKFFSAFAIICTHTINWHNGQIQLTVIELSTFAVPVFFLISGFYSYYENNSKAIQKYKTRSIKLIKLIIISNLLYFIASVVVTNNLFTLNYQVILDSITRFLVFNLGTYGHLWFLGALLYCYILFIILLKLNVKPKKLYKFIPLLLLSNIILGEVLKCNGIVLPCEYYRNFLFTGLPFFMLGYLIHDKYNEIIPKISNKQIAFSLIFIISLFMIEGLIVNMWVDLYVGSIFLSLLLFIYCVKNPKTLNLKVIGWIGGNLYAYIYILHPLVIRFIKKFNFKFDHLLSIETLIFTITVSYIIYLVIHKVKANYYSNISNKHEY